MTSKEPINSMLIHTIISCHVLMMIMNCVEMVIWPVWVVLGQICSLCLTNISFELPNFQAQILPDDTSKEPVNSMLIHTIISCHVQMMIMNFFELVIWSMWVMLGLIGCGA
jgi:hypothetical protein